MATANTRRHGWKRFCQTGSRHRCSTRTFWWPFWLVTLRLNYLDGFRPSFELIRAGSTPGARIIIKFSLPRQRSWLPIRRPRRCLHFAKFNINCEPTLSSAFVSSPSTSLVTSQRMPEIPHIGFFSRLLSCFLCLQAIVGVRRKTLDCSSGTQLRQWRNSHHRFSFTETALPPPSLVGPFVPVPSRFIPLLSVCLSHRFTKLT